VLPSVWPEPFGLAGIEAACAGLPGVAFAVGGVPDWLIPGTTGESAPADPPTAAGLADALVRAVADDGHRHHLGLGAWRSSKRFTPSKHLDGLTREFRDAAG
jgi:glycosyltransferase involved in cell wall biosynthesis